jgi:phage-related protein
MPSFPLLRTSAVAQYPASKTAGFRNRALRFVDGSEQRYRASAGMLRRWQLRLDHLDEAEAAALEEFLQANRGRLGRFAFTDPWEGATYPDCSFAEDVLTIQMAAEMRAALTVVVMENRAS